MPRKPNLLAVVGFWLLRRVGWLANDVIIARKPKLKDENQAVLHGTATYSLFGNDLSQRLFNLSRRLPPGEGKVARELIGYANQCGRISRAQVKFSRRSLRPELFLYYLKHYYSPDTYPGLEDFVRLIDAEITKLGSLQELIGIIPDSAPPTIQPLPAISNNNICYTTVPRWDKLGLEATVIGVEKVAFHEEMVRLIQGKQFRVAVCGPPGSGKSTTCATLASETQLTLESLKTRADFKALQVSATSADLDLGSPTQNLIRLGQGTDRIRHKSYKAPWEIDRVYPALRQLDNLTENIIFVDLPGKIDSITYLLLSMVDVGIIISNDWGKVNEWRRLLKNLGINIVAEARSHLLPTEDRPESLVRVFDSELITGRIVGAKRELRNWDSFLEFLAKALLYKTLPRLIQKEQKVNQAIIDSVWREKP